MLDKLQVAVRPRSLSESLELGFFMCRRWWKSLYLLWIVVSLPFFLALCFTLQPLWAIVIFIFCKPFFDRFILHFLSQATFGHQPDIAETLGFFKKIHGTQLFSSLTWLRFFDVGRSFTLPVRQLEGLKGQASRQRISLLKKRGSGGSASWLTFSYTGIELILFLVPLLYFYQNFAMSSMPLSDTLAELSTHLANVTMEFGALFLQEGGAYVWMTLLLYYLAVSVVEPLYVASGFSLYLNRRAQLESWDLEVSFRKLAKRLQGAQKAPLLKRGLLLLFMFCLPLSLMAQDSVKEEMKVILEDKKYGYQFEQERMMPPERKQAFERQAEGSTSGSVVGEVFQIMMWLIVGFGFVALFLMLYKAVKNAELNSLPEKKAVAETIFGMDIRPEQLPDDIAAEALSLWRQKKASEALSLLYRGALTYLAHCEEVTLTASNTEGDCMKMANLTFNEDRAQSFAELARSWQAVAYAHRLPEEGAFVSLCQSYKKQFGAKE